MEVIGDSTDTWDEIDGLIFIYIYIFGGFLGHSGERQETETETGKDTQQRSLGSGLKPADTMSHAYAYCMDR